MARKRDRIFAASGAALFLFTSSALAIAVIVQIVDSHNNPVTDANKASTALAQAKAQAKTQSKEKPVTDPSKGLAGKALAAFTPQSSIASLDKIDSVEGTGDEVKAGDTITVDYTGAVAATGTVFQSSLDTGQPVSFPLSGVITGWQQGIPGMKVGGTRRLLIPANLAYGAHPPNGSGIPANADLVFDVTVHKIGK